MEKTLAAGRLLVRFNKPHVLLSWAVYGGGLIESDTVVWYRVSSDDLEPPASPHAFLHQKLKAESLTHGVGLLTSADLAGYTDVEKVYEKLSARAIATVGLSSALRVGDPPREILQPGTINLLCVLSAPLSFEAHLEALSIAAEARTAAVLEAAIPSTQTSLPATGTGTDCIVMAAPREGPDSDETLCYAGKHTAAGHLIGKAVFEAVSRAIRRERD